MFPEPDAQRGALLLLGMQKQRGCGLGCRLQPCVQDVGFRAERQDYSTGLCSAGAAAGRPGVLRWTTQL